MSRTSIQLESVDLHNLREQGTSGSGVHDTPCSSSPENEPHGLTQQLKPADGGRDAWQLLIAAFVFESLLWGFPISFGVFQDYYTTLPQFADNSNVALIGTVAQGLSYLGAPFSAAVTKRFPKYQKLQIYIGWPICILGLVLGSFVSSLGGLIATQGVMYGFGFITLTYPIISMVNEWWITRKGMAFGLISCASGASGAVMPFILDAMLKRYGYKTTLRAIAVAMALLTGPLIPLLKGRLPPAEHSTMARMDWSFIKRPLFYIYALSTLTYGLGFFFPALYLPSYATALGLSSTQGALLLSIMAIAQVIGQFAFGYLSDKKISLNALCIACTVMATIASLAIWGFAKSLGSLVAFSLVFGFFASAFSTMRIAMGRAVSDDPSATVATYSIFVFLQGIGNILAGPISGRLLTQNVVLGSYGISSYKILIIFTGSCMIASAATIGSWCLQPKKLRFILSSRRSLSGR